jgi:hypothetical protein
MLPLIPILSALVQFAPTLAEWVGGPRAGAVAEQVVGIAKAVTGTADGDQALSAISANPDLALQFEAAVLAQQVELARIASGDRKDERAAEVAVAQTDASDRASARDMQVHLNALTPAILGWVVVVGFLGILTGILSGKLTTTDNQVLLILLGSLAAGFGQVLNFHFGSSSGSKAKSVELSKRP